MKELEGLVYCDLFTNDQIIYLIKNSGEIVTSYQVSLDDIVSFCNTHGIEKLNLLGSTSYAYFLQDKFYKQHSTLYNNNNLKIEVISNE